MKSNAWCLQRAGDSPSHPHVPGHGQHNQKPFIPWASSTKLGAEASLSQPCSDWILYFGNWQTPSVVASFMRPSGVPGWLLSWVKEQSSAGWHTGCWHTWAGHSPIQNLTSPHSSLIQLIPACLLPGCGSSAAGRAGQQAVGVPYGHQGPSPLCSPIGFGTSLPWGRVGEGCSPLSKGSQS